jgi:hypothetical protein
VSGTPVQSVQPQHDVAISGEVRNDLRKRSIKVGDVVEYAECGDRIEHPDVYRQVSRVGVQKRDAIQAFGPGQRPSFTNRLR